MNNSASNTDSTESPHAPGTPDAPQIPGAPTVRKWLADSLSPEAAKLIERLARASDVRRIAIMPDAHAGHDVCVGAVVGTSTLVYPQAVGSDIGCGMSTMRFIGPVPDERDRVNVLRRLQRKVRVLTREPGNITGPDPSLLSDAALAKEATRDGARELGTLGRGNHFVELQTDDDGHVWVLVHSGSRAMGQAITDFHLRRATAQGSGLASLDAATPAGLAYLSDAAWACTYASMSRRAMLDDVASALRNFDLLPDTAMLIDSCHNLVRAEMHNGQTLLVHRKGAATAGEAEAGVIPGSAGTYSVHVEGRGNADAMCSSGHGAGRVRSRSQARRELSASRFEREMQHVTFDRRLASRLIDESPSVYRNLRKVLAAQRDLVKITRTLHPIVSFKGV